MLSNSLYMIGETYSALLRDTSLFTGRWQGVNAGRGAARGGPESPRQTFKSAWIDVEFGDFK